jgi:hypothetical protein
MQQRRDQHLPTTRIAGMSEVNVRQEHLPVTAPEPISDRVNAQTVGEHLVAVHYPILKSQECVKGRTDHASLWHLFTMGSRRLQVQPSHRICGWTVHGRLGVLYDTQMAIGRG